MRESKTSNSFSMAFEFTFNLQKKCALTTKDLKSRVQTVHIQPALLPHQHGHYIFE